MEINKKKIESEYFIIFKIYEGKIDPKILVSDIILSLTKLVLFSLETVLGARF